jgi:thymidylate kinase
MKHIIIEGGDRLGKSTLIEGLAKHFNYDNVMIRHFGKPPKVFPEDMSPLEFQAKCFWKEAHFVEYVRQMENDQFCYYENVVIWNRAHLGEYVYGQMFRGQDPKELKEYLSGYETRNLLDKSDETFLILLTADPEFFLEQEDGNSFSQKLEEKKRELQLFDEIFEESLIDNKFRMKVNDGDNYLKKSYILTSVLEFMKYKNTVL